MYLPALSKHMVILLYGLHLPRLSRLRNIFRLCLEKVSVYVLRYRFVNTTVVIFRHAVSTGIVTNKTSSSNRATLMAKKGLPTFQWSIWVKQLRKGTTNYDTRKPYESTVPVYNVPEHFFVFFFFRLMHWQIQTCLFCGQLMQEPNLWYPQILLSHQI